MTNRPDGVRAWLSPDRIGIAAALIVAVTIGAALVDRPGYGPDEEITWFAVEGINAHGVPILPSGLAYFRGPSYSYLAWLSGLFGGPPLAAYRWLGVFSLAAVIAAASLLARTLFGRGAVTAWLIALAPAVVASGAYARFYMPFAAVCTATLLVATRLREGRRPRAWFVAGCVAARSLHEFGMLLALVPAAAWLSAESAEDRRTFARLLVVTASALVAEHLLFMWLPCVAWNCEAATWGFSSSGLPGVAGTALPVAAFASGAEIVSAIAVAGAVAFASSRMIRADTVFTIAAACAAAGFANGVVAALALLWVIARPSDARTIVPAGLLAAAAGSIAWIALVALRGTALIDTRFAWGLLQASLSFPWSGIQHLLTEQPVMMAMVALGMWRGAVALTTPLNTAARMLAMVLYLELLAFGATGTDVRSRFLVLVLPLMAVFAGAGIRKIAESAADAIASRSLRVARGLAGTIAIVAVVYVSFEQAAAIVPHREPAGVAPWWTRWSPPVALASLDIGRDMVQPGDIVVTNDELAAVMLLGRVDYWWPPDATSAERYSFADPHGGAPRGLYGGARVLPDPSALRQLRESRRSSRVVVVLFNTGKFGFDPSALTTLIDANKMVELDRRDDDWIIARFPALRSTF